MIYLCGIRVNQVISLPYAPSVFEYNSLTLMVYLCDIRVYQVISWPYAPSVFMYNTYGLPVWRPGKPGHQLAL